MRNQKKHAYWQAQTAGYLLSGASKTQTVYGWQQFCNQKKIPFILLSVGRHNARLEVHLEQMGVQFTLKALTILKLLCLLTNRMWRVSGLNVFVVTQLPVAQAEPFAQIITQLLRNFPNATQSNEEPHG